MEEAQRILLSSLASSGVSLPPGVSSIKDLTPDYLVSICAQSLRLIDVSLPSFPTSLPSNTVERFKVCSDLASAVRSLGYAADLTFRQFLYPSDEDSCQLVRFLVERLSQSSENRKAADNNITSSASTNNEATVDSFRGTSRQLEETIGRVEDGQDYQSAPLDTVAKVHSHELLDEGNIPGQSGESAGAMFLGPMLVSANAKESCCSKIAVKDVPEEDWNFKQELYIDRGNNSVRDNSYVAELVQKRDSLQVQLSKLQCQLENLQRKQKTLVEATHAKELEVRNLEVEYRLLEVATEKACSDQHSVELYTKELNEQLQAKRHNLMDLESQWNACKKALEEKKATLEQSLHASEPEVEEKLIQLKEIQQETAATISEIREREMEHSELLLELEKLPKIPSRKSYIQRITEITKNSWKQDADIDRIIQDTRELQLDSNSIQERLHRTYAVVEETVVRYERYLISHDAQLGRKGSTREMSKRSFYCSAKAFIRLALHLPRGEELLKCFKAQGDSKSDTVSRRVYRLLTDIHDSFEQISEKILATDRARREVTDLEAKLTSIVSHSFDIDKLQADLDLIRKENELLEQQLH